MATEMPTIDQFTRAWKRTTSPSLQDNPPIDQDIFPDGATLLIGIAAGTSPECHIIWRDGKGASWCISNLTFQNGMLTGESIPRRSPDDATRRSVNLWIDQDTNRLQGDIRAEEGSGVDGPVGTFTAEADDPKS